MVGFGEIVKFDPEQIREIFSMCSAQQKTCDDLSTHVKKLSDLHTWQGDAAKAAKDSAGKTHGNITSHGREAWKVAAAARDCYDEGVALKTAARQVQADADARGFRIDPVFGTVTDSKPLNLRGLADDDKQAYYAEIKAFQARVNAVIADAERFDDDLAAAINAADGAIPLKPVGEGDNVNLADRRANQVAAFKNATGRVPSSENDWKMAAQLDPHNYDPKYKGVNSKIVIQRIRRVQGQGLVRSNEFIKQRDVADPSSDNPLGRNKGDNRNFDQNFDPEHSRVAAFIDYDNGIVAFRQNPSVVQEADGSPGHVETGTPRVSVTQSANGAVRLKYDAADPIGAGGPSRYLGWSVNGDVTYTPTAQGATASGTRTNFPWYEAYQSFPDGRESTIAREDPPGLGIGTSYGPLLNLKDHHEIGDHPSLLSRVASNFILDSAAEAAVSPALVEAELAKSLIEKLAGK